MRPLALADLREAHDRVRLAGRLVYAVSEHVPVGKVIQAKETASNYEFWVFHSEEEAQAAAASSQIELLHLRHAPTKISKNTMSEY